MFVKLLYKINKKILTRKMRHQYKIKKERGDCNVKRYCIKSVFCCDLVFIKKEEENK